MTLRILNLSRGFCVRLWLGTLSSIPAVDLAARTDNYYVQNRSYRTIPSGDIPRYVRPLSKTGLDGAESFDWLDIGLDHRIRYEYRDQDFRRTPQQGLDEAVLLRTRAYLGIRRGLDPFRFAAEFQDSRSYNSAYVSDNRDVNELDLIQLYGELYFADALGSNRPLSIKGGRFWLESLDRRLIANNEFRNTTNNFQGVRVNLGQQSNDWELDFLALQPIERLKYRFDRPVEQEWLYGIITHWRRWSDIVTLQPYYLGYRHDSKTVRDAANALNLHNTGLRGYGMVGTSGFDYDANVVHQFGRSNGRQPTSAWACAVELGYTFEHTASHPRISTFYGYGSGDRNPGDGTHQTFNPLFGFNQPWSRNDYFSWDNLHAPKLRLELEPLKDLKMETGYNAYWLASDRAAWKRASLQDKTGQSGSFLGHEFDIRFRYKWTPRIESDVSYAWFTPGEMPRLLGKIRDGHFLYLQLTLSAFN
jgi:hypothetical protein